ncbi:UNVERIFIED_CONTAM: hypothetical protein H355_002114 [Colinus virginianus]|nr:hypothetical protein H355_002114 [Colinus virginianus]
MSSLLKVIKLHDNSQWGMRVAEELICTYMNFRKTDCLLYTSNVATIAYVTWQKGLAYVQSTVSLLSSCLQNGQNVAFILKGIGVLFIDRLTFEMKFYYDFVEKLSGKKTFRKAVSKAEVEETLKRIQSQKGVQGIIVVNSEENENQEKSSFHDHITDASMRAPNKEVSSSQRLGTPHDCWTNPLMFHEETEIVLFCAKTHSLYSCEEGPLHIQESNRFWSQEQRYQRVQPYGVSTIDPYRCSSGGPFPVEPHQLHVTEDEPSSTLTSLTQ